MKYSRIIVPLVTVVCILSLLSSYISWKDRLDSVETGVKTNQSSHTKIVESNDNESAPKNEQITLTRNNVEEATKNADEQVQNIILNRFDASEKIQLLIAGSSAMDDGSPSYSTLLADALAHTYGGFIETTVAPFDVTSSGFIEEKMNEIDWSKGYDLVLFEPFTLNNNGKVKIEDEHKHIKLFEQKVLEEVPDAVVILQPSYPIYHANFYLVQIRALEKFAISKGYPYINHWSAWPDTTDSALNVLLTENNSPNNEGAKVWASSLITYFTVQ